MDALEVIEAIGRGEDSQHQFKRYLANEKAAAAEMAAFANAEGGTIFLGVEDNGTLTGLTSEEVRRQNQIVSNAASQHVRSPINPRTQNLTLPGGQTVIVVTVPEGDNKPYFDSDGVIWQKVGADKRRVTAKEELRRLFQESDLLQADEIPVRGCNVFQVNEEMFAQYFEARYHENFPGLASAGYDGLSENLNLARDGQLNLAGLLLFGKDPQRFKPAFMIKAVRFIGVQDTGTAYEDSQDFGGRLDEQFKGAMDFLGRKLPGGTGRSIF